MCSLYWGSAGKERRLKQNEHHSGFWQIVVVRSAQYSHGQRSSEVGSVCSFLRIDAVLAWRENGLSFLISTWFLVLFTRHANACRTAGGKTHDLLKLSTSREMPCLGFAVEARTKRVWQRVFEFFTRGIHKKSSRQTSPAERRVVTTPHAQSFIHSYFKTVCLTAVMTFQRETHRSAQKCFCEGKTCVWSFKDKVRKELEFWTFIVSTTFISEMSFIPVMYFDTENGFLVSGVPSATVKSQNVFFGGRSKGERGMTRAGWFVVLADDSVHKFPALLFVCLTRHPNFQVAFPEQSFPNDLPHFLVFSPEANVLKLLFDDILMLHRFEAKITTTQAQPGAAFTADVKMRVWRLKFSGEEKEGWALTKNACSTWVHFVGLSFRWFVACCGHIILLFWFRTNTRKMNSRFAAANVVGGSVLDVGSSSADRSALVVCWRSGESRVHKRYSEMQHRTMQWKAAPSKRQEIIDQTRLAYVCVGVSSFDKTHLWSQNEAPLRTTALMASAPGSERKAFREKSRAASF